VRVQRFDGAAVEAFVEVSVDVENGRDAGVSKSRGDEGRVSVWAISRAMLLCPSGLARTWWRLYLPRRSGVACLNRGDGGRSLRWVPSYSIGLRIPRVTRRAMRGSPPNRASFSSSSSRAAHISTSRGIRRGAGTVRGW